MKIFRLVSLFAGIVLLICLLAGCQESPEQKQRGPDGSVSPPLEVGGAADFTLPDLEGRSFRLSQSRGKPVLLIFSTTWCAYCRSELPHFREIYERHRSDGLEVVQIFIQESSRKVSSFASENALPYRVLLDEKGAVSQTFGIRGVPFMILLDRDGRVLCRGCPSLDASLEDLFRQPRPGKS